MFIGATFCPGGVLQGVTFCPGTNFLATNGTVWHNISRDKTHLIVASMLLPIRQLSIRQKRERGLLRLGCTFCNQFSMAVPLVRFSLCFTSKKGQIHFNEKSTCLNFKTLTSRISWVYISFSDRSVNFFNYNFQREICG